jgi:hypothetical protein
MSHQGSPTKTHTAQRIDPTCLKGDWINTESSPRGLARILIERRSDDAVAVRVLGVQGGDPEGMKGFDAPALYASSATGGDAAAFIAGGGADDMPAELQANLSKGLLIVSSFWTRSHSDGLERCFAREFFRRADPNDPASSDVSQKAPEARPLSPGAAASTFGGSWQNTNTTGSGIASVSFDPMADDGTLSVRGRSDADNWGTTAFEIYNEIGALSDPARIKARYDLGSMDVELHGWVKQGVLVLALFRRYKDELGAASYFDREFFYRTGRHTNGER